MIYIKYSFTLVITQSLHGLVLHCAPSLIHLFATHLTPSTVGHAPCSPRESLTNQRRVLGVLTNQRPAYLAPSVSRLYQNTTLPIWGRAATPIFGKAVKPPER